MHSVHALLACTGWAFFFSFFSVVLSADRGQDPPELEKCKGFNGGGLAAWARATFALLGGQ